MDTMLTLGAAARQLGVSKGTISKAIATGKLSATRREDGSWAIDGSELARYLEVNGHRFRSETIPSEQVATEAELRARADLAEQRLADLRSMYEDMKAQRDKWETVAQRLSLPAPKPVETPETAPRTPSRTAVTIAPLLALAALDRVGTGRSARTACANAPQPAYRHLRRLKGPKRWPAHLTALTSSR